MPKHQLLLLKHRLRSHPAISMAPREVPRLRAPHPLTDCPQNKVVHPNLLLMLPMYPDTGLNSLSGLTPPALKKRALLPPRGNPTRHRVLSHQSANPTTRTPAASGSHNQRIWHNWTHDSSSEAVTQSGHFVLGPLGRPVQVMSPNQATRKAYLEITRRNTMRQRVEVTIITAPCPS